MNIERDVHPEFSWPVVDRCATFLTHSLP